jgi:hypothetical protein
LVTLDIDDLSNCCRFGIAGMMICGHHESLESKDIWRKLARALALAILSKHPESCAIIFVASADVPASAQGFGSIEYYLRQFGYRGHVMEIEDVDFSYGYESCVPDDALLESFASAVSCGNIDFMLFECALWPMEMVRRRLDAQQ